jgi:hypothetical protein
MVRKIGQSESRARCGLHAQLARSVGKVVFREAHRCDERRGTDTGQARAHDGVNPRRPDGRLPSEASADANNDPEVSVVVASLTAAGWGSTCRPPRTWCSPS